MGLLDLLHHNFFNPDLSLIMDFIPYRERIIYGKPMRTPEHRILYIADGHSILNIASTEYSLVKGSILLIPRGSVFSIEDISTNHNPWALAFNTPEADGNMLMPYLPIQIVLSPEEQQTISDYFRMIDKLLHKRNVNRRGVDFLIVSMLFHLHTLIEDANQMRGQVPSSRSAIIRDKFLYYVNMQGIPSRDVGWYANLLRVSAGYLRATIKAQTKQSPMQWINLATIREAKLLLIDPQNYTLDEIASELHLNSASQLIKFYKKETGETPIAFRKRITSMADQQQ